MRIVYFLVKPQKPESDPSYNRIFLYCKGLKEKGVDSYLYLIPPTQGKSRILILFSIIGNYFKIFSFLLRKAKRNDVLVFYGETLYFLLFPFLSLWYRLVIERNEYPNYLISPGVERKEKSERFLKRLKYAEGLITCSTYLDKFYRQYLSDNAWTLIAPLIVNVNDFAQSPSSEKNEDDIILYCGSFNNNKDGIPILIEAFSELHKKYPTYQLYLVGGGNDTEVAKMHKCAEEHAVSDCVVFTGMVPHSSIPSYFSKAKIFALARPNNKQAEGGIPSKLAEYMAARKPCVITSVGDLPNYFTGGIDCYMAEPSSATSFAKELEKCILNDNSKMVENAYNKVKSFDYVIQSDVLLEKLYDER